MKATIAILATRTMVTTLQPVTLILKTTDPTKVPGERK